MKTSIHLQILGYIGIIFSSVVYTACHKDTVPIPENTKAQYNMYLTDAPANYQQVNVNIIGAQVHSVAGWTSLNVQPGIYNLLSLSNGNNILLASGKVTTGPVSQIQLLLG